MVYIQRVRRSIAAVIALFILGGIVLGLSFLVFEPTGIIPTFLIVVAGMGLPLGAFIIHTLTVIEKQETHKKTTR